EAVIGTPTYDLTNFKVHFGRLTLKAYTKGEHVLRVEAITHNTKDLHCGRVLERFGDITARRRGSCCRGSRPTRTAWTTSSGCGGRRASSVRAAAILVAGDSLMAGSGAQGATLV